MYKLYTQIQCIELFRLTTQAPGQEVVRVEQLQGMDASFIALERPHAPMHIGSIMIYDPSTAPNGFVRFKDILRFIESRLQLSKTMRQRLVKVPFGIDYPYWVEDPNFDLEYHVRHLALPEPGDWRQLCIQTSRLFSRPLDLTRPPWELTVIEGLDNLTDIPKGSYAMVTKVHHSAIDGASGIDMMQALHTLTADAGPPESPDLWAPEAIPNQLGLFAKGYVRGLTNPFRFINAIRKTTPGLVKAATGLVTREYDFYPVVNTPRTRFNRSISAARVISGRAFPLAGIKAIRAVSEGAKVNDVMLAIVGGALHKYLSAKDDLPTSSMTAMAPISVRAEGEKNTMGNQVSAMFVPIGTHITDATERLEFVHEHTIKSKAMTNAIGARRMTEVSKVSPHLYMGLAAKLYSQFGVADYMRPVFNTVITNVPGPPVPIYSAGAKVVNVYGLLCLLDGYGLGHVVQSYTDKSTITFTACRKMMPDPEFYAQCLQESYDELATAAGFASSKKELARKTTKKRSAKKPPVVKKTGARKSVRTAKARSASEKAT